MQIPIKKKKKHNTTTHTKTRMQTNKQKTINPFSLCSQLLNACFKFGTA